jgi:hypothetical protein
MWKDTDLCVELCVEHFNVFINDKIEVTTDLQSPWRNPTRAQVVLDEICDQGLDALHEEGDAEKAGNILGMAQAHVQNCVTQGLELNKERMEELERRLIGGVY